jgi:hypothetical protein
MVVLLLLMVLLLLLRGRCEERATTERHATCHPIRST